MDPSLSGATTYPSRPARQAIPYCIRGNRLSWQMTLTDGEIVVVNATR
jgi:hypothetical protein